ncbi:MAG: HPr family phosphocarrier protein [Gammaproteobacteria bacterium]|nr:HPr family phosphocarrier protein [Gammaproteobacteria bacterium]
MVRNCTVGIINKRGMHARAAARFASTAATFTSHISVRRGELTANGKSIMGLLMLAAPQGAEITIQAEGPDAEQALEALVTLVSGRFGEAE